MRKHRNCLIVGPAGTGKSWLGCALGDKACLEDFSVLSDFHMVSIAGHCLAD
jgi:DNA replication protein DnaC